MENELYKSRILGIIGYRREAPLILGMKWTHIYGTSPFIISKNMVHHLFIYNVPFLHIHHFIYLNG